MVSPVIADIPRVGGGVHARGVRASGRVARVGLVDDVAGAVLGVLQDVAVFVEEAAAPVHGAAGAPSSVGSFMLPTGRPTALPP
ncbi:hypothetical protein [Streptomyces sp. NPDC006355]|uniref:hypothetical protein n=1 Tax=Streptomyces sp. NPDC006355 TaxID=3156758 RepID=UPI0033BCCC20